MDELKFPRLMCTIYLKLYHKLELVIFINTIKVVLAIEHINEIFVGKQELSIISFFIQPGKLGAIKVNCLVKQS